MSNISVAQVKIYPGISFGSEIETVGLTLGGEYFVSEKVSITPDFIYYFPKKESQVFSGSKIEVTGKLWELNGNVHYYFSNNANLGFYGLGGLNYSHMGVKYKQTDTDTGQTEAEYNLGDGEAGLNLGIGANFSLGKNFSPFLEMKYVIASTDQLVLTSGLKFDL
ncbi:MAG: hypothetical protein DHS20C17_33240 [Cyclobacteriaceae bacterium]|nr:MAG: hypothetical protein DHS20C17_33240 [Cyclobacteriaceae bacterium]